VPFLTSRRHAGEYAITRFIQVVQILVGKEELNRSYAQALIDAAQALIEGLGAS
jgi:hypothetical protein